jgi:hypothetical protein
LERHGASTAEQIESEGFQVLELCLNREEIDGVIESARRHGLIVATDSSQRTVTDVSPKPEWAPTERGRSRIAGLGQTAAGTFKLVPFALLATVLTAVSKKYDLLDHWLVVVLAIGGVAAVVMAAIALIFRRSFGATQRKLAAVWDRHAVELPGLNRYFRSRRRLFAYAFATVVIIGANVGLLGSHIDWQSDVLAFSSPLIAATLILFFEDSLRLRTLRREAAVARSSRSI